MSTTHLRRRLLNIAMRDVGYMETSKNQGPAIQKFWSATSYPSGFRDRAPYCAAAGCYWIREWLKDSAVREALKLTVSEAEEWRCKSPLVFDWPKWARDENLEIIPPDQTIKLGDIVVFEFSHYGIVSDVEPFSEYFVAVEANTGPAGGRDGEGIFLKRRHRDSVRCFIRLLA